MALETIAAEMKKYAIENPRRGTVMPIEPYQHRLGGGLCLSLYLDLHHVWHLSLTRQDIAPSRGEVVKMKQVFGIPSDATESQRKVGKIWYVFRFTWPDEGPKKFEVGPKTPSYFSPGQRYYESVEIN